MRDAVESQELQECNNLCQVRHKRWVHYVQRLSCSTAEIPSFPEPLLFLESAGKDAWSWVPLVQATHGSACVCCGFHRSWCQIPRLLHRSESQWLVLMCLKRFMGCKMQGNIHVQVIEINWRPRWSLWRKQTKYNSSETVCARLVFQIQPLPGICTAQGWHLYPSRPGAK